MCIPIFAGLGAAMGASASTAAAVGTMTAASMAATGISAYSAIQQGKAAEKVGRNNAAMAEHSAQDAQRRGEQSAMEVQRRAAALKSAQRVSLASKGLDLTYGTAADLQDQTDFFGQSDVITTRDNARRAAWNARAGGQMALSEGHFARSNSQLQAAGSLLSGAGQVADKWHTYRKGP
jgi:hypothetical protein